MTPSPIPLTAGALHAESAALRALARALLDDSHEAEDASQDAWVAALQTPPIRVESLIPWLHRVVGNLARRTIERKRSRRAREAAAARPEAVPPTADSVARLELFRRVVEAVLALDEPYRETIVLRFWDGLPPRAIAERMGVPVATVRTRVRRALQTLRARLDRACGGRAAWGALLAARAGDPLAAAAPAAVSVSLLLGATLMKKTILGAGVLAAILAGIWLWTLPPAAPPAGSTPPPAAGTGDVTAAAPAGAAKEAEAPLRSAAGDAPASAAAPATLGSLLVRAIWGDDKTPAAGIFVRIRRDGGLDDLFDPIVAKTGDDGVAVLEALAPGTYNVVARYGHSGQPERVEIVAGKESEASLTIAAGLSVRGIVVDQAGRSVPGADVVIAHPFFGDPDVVAQTDTRGCFALRGLGPHVLIGARARGHAPSVLHVLGGSSATTLDTLRIELRGAGGSLGGRVVDPRGEPVPGAVVEVGSLSRGMRPLPTNALITESVAWRAQTDKSGAFTFDGLTPEKMAVAVRARGLAPWSGAVEIVAGRAAELRVQLTEGVILHGMVRDANGMAAAGIGIGVGEHRRLDYRQARTDAAGSFRLDGLAAGSLAVRAASDALGRAEATLEGVPGQTIEWNPVLSKGLVLRGRVLDPGGKAVAQASVDAWPVQRTSASHWVGHAITDEHGRFQLDRCEPGRELFLAVHARGFAELQLSGVVPGSDEVVVRLREEDRALAFLTGSLVQPDGKPAGNAEVQVMRRDGDRAVYDRSDAGTGALRLGPLPAGDYRLHVRATGFGRLVTDWFSVGRAETRDIGVVPLQLGGSLVVSLRQAGGQPITPEQAKRVRLTIWSEDGGYLESILEVRDSIGRSVALAPGRYVLGVWGDGVASRAYPCQVRDAAETRIDVAVEGGVEVEVALECGEQARNGVPIAVTGSDGRLVHVGTAFRRGEQAFGTSFVLVPGRYEVTATAVSSRGTATLEVRGGEREPARARIVLR